MTKLLLSTAQQALYSNVLTIIINLYMTVNTFYRYVRLRITKAHEYLKLKFLMCCLCDYELPYMFYTGGSIGKLVHLRLHACIVLVLVLHIIGTIISENCLLRRCFSLKRSMT